MGNVSLGEREIICIYEVGSAASGTGRLDGNPDTWQSSTIRPGLKGADQRRRGPRRGRETEQKGANRGLEEEGNEGRRVIDDEEKRWGHTQYDFSTSTLACWTLPLFAIFSQQICRTRDFPFVVLTNFH